MIFITVGTQIAFPRLLNMFEEAAPELIGRAFAQTSDPGYAGSIRSVVAMSRNAFEETCAKATLILGHAGMGTIFAARRHEKPLIVVPRLFALNEHRNDHQVATAEQLARMSPAVVCGNSRELAQAVRFPPAAMRASGTEGKAQLVAAVKAFIDNELQAG